MDGPPVHLTEVPVPGAIKIVKAEDICGEGRRDRDLRRGGVVSALAPTVCGDVPDLLPGTLKHVVGGRGRRL